MSVTLKNSIQKQNLISSMEKGAMQSGAWSKLRQCKASAFLAATATATAPSDPATWDGIVEEYSLCKKKNNLNTNMTLYSITNLDISRFVIQYNIISVSRLILFWDREKVWREYSEIGRGSHCCWKKLTTATAERQQQLYRTSRRHSLCSVSHLMTCLCSGWFPPRAFISTLVVIGANPFGTDTFIGSWRKRWNPFLISLSFR